MHPQISIMSFLRKQESKHVIPDPIGNPDFLTTENTEHTEKTPRTTVN
jgi:hypothetical protein